MDYECCFLIVLFAIPVSVELSQWIGVGSWGCPISSIMRQIIFPLGIDKEGTKFCLSSRHSNKSQEGCENVYRSIQFYWLFVSGEPSKEEVSCSMAFCFVCTKICSIRVDVNYHMRLFKFNFYIQMHWAVIKKVFNCVCSELWGFGLFSCNCAEYHEQGDVNSPGIVKYGSNNLLNFCLVLWSLIFLW